MDREKSYGRVSAIVPAFNEAERIGDVITVLLSSPLLDEIIVVDDGSTDATASVVAQYPVRYFKQEVNGGKGKALDRGVAAAEHDVLFFCDADMKGLTSAIVKEIVEPVVNGRVDMFVAMINRRSFALRFILTFVPLLGGQRALTKPLWQKIPSSYKKRFRIEAALNFYAKYYGRGFGFKVFPGLSQTIKEKKYGMWRGLVGRARMIVDVIMAQAGLQMMELPATLTTKRLAVLGTLGSLAGFALGVVIVIAAVVGPIHVIRVLFGEYLYEPYTPPFVEYLISITALIGRRLLMLGGFVLMVLNFFFMLLQGRHLVGWPVAEFSNGRKNFSEDTDLIK